MLTIKKRCVSLFSKGNWGEGVTMVENASQAKGEKFHMNIMAVRKTLLKSITISLKEN